MKYTITLEGFEGPFDLLYHLIEKSEVDIYDIPIADIAEQYIAYLSHMEELDLEVTSEFLLMAATLLEIKSKMLLPDKKAEGEQLEMDEVDPREELIRRLIEYKKYKTAAEELKNRQNIYGKVFYKPKEEIEVIDDEDNDSLEGVELAHIIKAFDRIIKKKAKDNISNKFHEIKREEITIEGAMNLIRNKLVSESDIDFEQLFEDTITKGSIVALFVGVLELMKLNEITIFQDNNFANIKIKKT